ncbi:unannotated protein [freshwater metagenome]|uniref:Unannotated protein n=1 Tax=freshwater metagenome TaxID=449393 RepID=A0A6J7P095_9ZZZZ
MSSTPRWPWLALALELLIDYRLPILIRNATVSYLNSGRNQQIESLHAMLISSGDSVGSLEIGAHHGYNAHAHREQCKSAAHLRI